MFYCISWNFLKQTSFCSVPDRNTERWYSSFHGPSASIYCPVFCGFHFFTEFVLLQHFLLFLLFFAYHQVFRQCLSDDHIYVVHPPLSCPPSAFLRFSFSSVESSLFQAEPRVMSPWKKLCRISKICSSVGPLSFIFSMIGRLMSFSFRDCSIDEFFFPGTSEYSAVRPHPKRSESFLTSFNECKIFRCVSDNWLYLCL